MEKHSLLKLGRYAALSFILLSALFIFTQSVLAISEKAAEKSNRPTTVGRDAVTLKAKPTLTPTGEAKLRACKTKEDATKRMMLSLQALVNKMFNNFSAIALRVETFYTTKVVAAGKTVPNYAALVADIDTQKAAVQTAVTKAQTDVDGFSCESGNPKTILKQYHGDMQAVKRALQNYRKAIKNLIVAVRSSAGVAESSLTGTPVPTSALTPTPTGTVTVTPTPTTPVSTPTPTTAVPTSTPTPTPTI
ncbi:MAG: hypothetical protein Q7S03_03610 [bacterium]|nr:hypothetical protein [bacterium]